MKASTWAALSFGATLGLVVGWRLTPLGLLLVAALLIGGLLLGPFLLRRWIGWYLDQLLPEVWVERSRGGGLGAAPTRARALEAQPQQTRRGGWPHLEELVRATEMANVER